MNTDQKFILDWEELESAIFPLDELFSLEVDYKGVKYEFLIRLASSNKNLICFGSGAYNPKKFSPPVYNRHTWEREFAESVIYYNDPTLYNNNVVTLGWCVGRDDQWYLEGIADIIGVLASKNSINNNKMLFFGSSGGGFTALMLATLFKGSSALVNNPQIFLINYYPRHFENMLNACFSSPEDVEGIREKYGYRFDVTRIFQREGHIPHITYLVNINSTNDLEKQLIPFINSLSSFEDFDGQLEVILYPSDQGHSGVLDKDETVNMLKNHFQETSYLLDEINALKMELDSKDDNLSDLKRKFSREISYKHNPSDLEKRIREQEQRIIQLQTIAGYTDYKVKNITMRLKRRSKKFLDKIKNPYYQLYRYYPGVDFNQLTMVIPYRMTDDPDREENLDITVRYLSRIGIVNLIISEHSDESSEEHLKGQYADLFKNFQVIHTEAHGDLFNRAQARNKGIMNAETPFIATSDLDCLTRERNIRVALGLLQKGYDVVHPFNHRVTDIVDKKAFKGDYNFQTVKSPEQNRRYADGGIIFWRKESFISIGMENEYFLGWGGEDNEIMLRAKICGLKHHRIDDTLYHLYHEQPQTRTKNNVELVQKTQKLKNKNECLKEVNKWPWVREAKKNSPK